MGLYNVITDHILYSTNDGKDWNLYYFDDLQIIIKNILKGFIIYGTTIEGYGIMI